MFLCALRISRPQVRRIADAPLWKQLTLTPYHWDFAGTGLDLFRAIMTNDRFRGMPLILETPGRDPSNAAVLRSLADGSL